MAQSALQADGSGATAPLRLPNGRKEQIRGDERDLSILGALRAGDGDWEPHVRAFFEQTVKPDWVCLDIGANIGAHALSLAALTTTGKVYAFEASPKNFAYLRANIEALFPDGRALPVHAAVWDRPGFLDISTADEVAGCAFVTEATDAPRAERKLRAVVSADALRDRVLHMSVDRIAAMRLDDWLRENAVRRVDLVKIDVEGSEVRALSGARAMLDRDRPIVVTEYNPACAVEYFGAAPNEYFHFLRGIFPAISVIEAGGSLSAPLQDWNALKSRLETGRGWEDLACLSPPSPRP